MFKLNSLRKSRIKRKFPNNCYISVEVYDISNGKVSTCKAEAFLCNPYLDRYDYAFKESIVLQTSRLEVAKQEVRDWALPLLAIGVPVQVTTWRDGEVLSLEIL